jgi:hypothetical protein
MVHTQLLSLPCCLFWRLVLLRLTPQGDAAAPLFEQTLLLGNLGDQTILDTFAGTLVHESRILK